MEGSWDYNSTHGPPRPSAVRIECNLLRSDEEDASKAMPYSPLESRSFAPHAATEMIEAALRAATLDLAACAGKGARITELRSRSLPPQLPLPSRATHGHLGRRCVP